MILRCGQCGKCVSSEVPDDTIVRACLECPECISRESFREHEMQENWNECMMHSAIAKASYDAAMQAGMSEKYCLKSSVVALSRANDKLKKMLLGFTGFHP